MEKNLLSNKNVLITGGSRGIGAQIVRTLAQHGARIAFTYSSNENLANALLEEINNFDISDSNSNNSNNNNNNNNKHFCVKMNLQNEESIDEAFHYIFSKFENKIFGLVNNAGINKDSLMLKMKIEDFDQVIRVNLRGTFLCTQKSIKHMIKEKAGSIVNITSVVGQKGNPGQTNYSASKAGVEALSKSLALEISSRNIRVNCVAPGYIDTEMTNSLTETQKENIYKQIPLKSFGNTLSVSNTVLFLLSDYSDYITGHTINVNGGMYMN